MKTNSFLPASFCFKFGFKDGSSPSSDPAFQEISGLSITQETSEIKEGGENRFVHKVPGRTKFEDLTLKRGLLLWDSPLANWCKAQLESGLTSQYITPKDVTLNLLDANTSAILMTWNFARAYPVKWSFSDLDASKSSIMVETLVLTYNYFTIIKNVKPAYLTNDS